MDTNGGGVDSIIGLEETNETDSSSDLNKTKRLLHFSDGTLDEPWDAVDEDDEERQSPDALDRATGVLTTEGETGQTFKDRVWSMGSRLITGIDYIGEGLASFLGITTPKFVSKSYAESVYKNDVRRGGEEEDQSVGCDGSLEEVNWSNSESTRVITVAPHSSSTQAITT